MDTKHPKRHPPCIGGEDAPQTGLSPEQILFLKTFCESWNKYGTRIPITMQDLNPVLMNPSDSFKTFLVTLEQVNVSINVDKDVIMHLGDDHSVNFGGNATNNGNIITGDVGTINNNVDAGVKDGNTLSTGPAKESEPEEKKAINKLYALLFALISSGTLAAIIRGCAN